MHCSPVVSTIGESQLNKSIDNQDYIFNDDNVNKSMERGLNFEKFK